MSREPPGTEHQRREPSVAWSLPWQPVTAEEGLALDAELRRELPRGHWLRGVAVCAIGRRVDCDDVLYGLDGDPRCVVVHLTYSREWWPQWPETRSYASLEDWLGRCMKVDADDYAGPSSAD